MDKIQFKINNEQPIDIPNTNMRRDTLRLYSVVAIEEQNLTFISLDLLEKISTANTVQYRASGRSGSKDFTLTPEDQAGLRWLLQSYKEMTKKDVSKFSAGSMADVKKKNVKK